MNAAHFTGEVRAEIVQRFTVLDSSSSIPAMFEPFVDTTARSLAPFLSRWIAPPVVAERLAEELASSFALRSDPAWCAEVAETMASHGRPDSEYSLRQLDLGWHGQVIAGIHFLGLDPAKPFVAIYGQSEDLSGPGLQSAVDRLLDHFGPFQPGSVRLFVPGVESLDGFPPGTRPDQRLLVGHLAELCSLPRPPRFGDIELRAMSDRGYERYLAACEQLFVDTPVMREMLEIEPRDGLSSCQACFEGWLTESVEPGRRGDDEQSWAGLIAARHDAAMGMTGHCMIEELLARSVRGQGLGPAFQRHLIERIEPHGDGLLWGTIDARNHPSRKTAARVGRLDIGGWIFIPRQ